MRATGRATREEANTEKGGGGRTEANTKKAGRQAEASAWRRTQKERAASHVDK